MGNAGEHCSFLTRQRLCCQEDLMMKMALMVAMGMALLAGACSKDTQLDSIARELETTVNRCVIDVRDKTSNTKPCPTAAPSAR